jgi:hypothetical protein
MLVSVDMQSALKDLWPWNSVISTEVHMVSRSMQISSSAIWLKATPSIAYASDVFC